MKQWTTVIFLIIFTILAMTLPAPASQTQKADDHFIHADDILYKALPEYGGLELAVLYGNPNEQGPYTIQVKFPPNVRSKTHTHDKDRYITVLSGTWHFGLGASRVFDANLLHGKI